MSADALQRALAAIGIDSRVEERGRVAVLTGELPVDAAARRRVVALGRDHGFSNVAFELTLDADLPGD